MKTKEITCLRCGRKSETNDKRLSSLKNNLFEICDYCYNNSKERIFFTAKRRKNLKKVMIEIIKLENKSGVMIFLDELKKKCKLTKDEFEECIRELEDSCAIIIHNAKNKIIQRF